VNPKANSATSNRCMKSSAPTAVAKCERTTLARPAAGGGRQAGLISCRRAASMLQPSAGRCEAGQTCEIGNLCFLTDGRCLRFRHCSIGFWMGGNCRQRTRYADELGRHVAVALLTITNHTLCNLTAAHRRWQLPHGRGGGGGPKRDCWPSIAAVLCSSSCCGSGDAQRSGKEPAAAGKSPRASFSQRACR
jgi:hypothetical protein